MISRALFAAALVSASFAACSPSQNYHGYIADEAAPADIEPGVDTRSTVLARLGSPSTKSVFDDDTWIYLSATREQFAFYRPKTAQRTVTAIKFGEDDSVQEVGLFNVDDGQTIRYASAETPTRGRELGLLEQIFGTIGAIQLPEERDPNSPTGQRR